MLKNDKITVFECDETHKRCLINLKIDKNSVYDNVSEHSNTNQLHL